MILSQPPQLAAAEQVQVEMGNQLAGMASRVDHQTIAILGDALRSREFGGHMYHVSQQPFLLRVHLGKGRHMNDRDYEQMCRRLGVDIADGDNLTIPVQDVARDFAADNSAEDTVFVHRTPSPRLLKETGKKNNQGKSLQPCRGE